MGGRGYCAGDGMGKQVAASIKKKRPWETMGQACAGGQGIRKRRAGDSGGWQKQPQRAGRSRPACTLKTPYRSEMGKRNLSKKKDIKHIDIRETNKQERSRHACSYACMQAEESKNAATLCSRRGQARKGAGRMPWH